jgi:hypothetical protein
MGCRILSLKKLITHRDSEIALKTANEGSNPPAKAIQNHGEFRFHSPRHKVPSKFQYFSRKSGRDFPVLEGGIGTGWKLQTLQHLLYEHGKPRYVNGQKLRKETNTCQENCFCVNDQLDCPWARHYWLTALPWCTKRLEQSIWEVLDETREVPRWLVLSRF